MTRAAYHRAYRALRKAAGRPCKGGPSGRSGSYVRPIIAIDGEGYTTADGKHLYTYMAACTETECVSELSCPEGVQFSDVAEWLLSLPKRALIVGFSLGYDRTKWIESLPTPAIYKLAHPEERQGSTGPRMVKLKAGYKVQLVSSLFRVKRWTPEMTEQQDARSPSVAVWDLFKFFQCSFVKALREWKVGSEEQVASVERMKQKRGTFRGIGAKEQVYCQTECKLLAKLAKDLLDAHEACDLKLTSYYGPGSTAGIILKRCKADVQCHKELPEELDYAVRCAFFGGRFETSAVGPIDAPVYAYDIASAYPYMFCQLPCLDPKHGRWRTRAWEPGMSPVTLIRFILMPSKDANPAWGPLPHRLPTGDIVFPVRGAGGWAWASEIEAAMLIHPGVQPVSCYTWERQCDCNPPFREVFASAYRSRLKLGKSARGRVVRLGPNAAYGKSAQRVGSGRFRCLVRAGLITSGVRAMLLRAIALAPDPWDVLELATDSVMTRVPLSLPAPLSLGTHTAAKKHGKPPLGAWEDKQWEGGVFLMRPGLRFPLQEEAKEKHTAARGVGTRVLHANRARILRAWDASPMTTVTVQQPAMFIGARLGVRKTYDEPDEVGERPFTFKRDEKYGRWIEPQPRELRYAPGPKRAAVIAGKGTWDRPHFRLAPWELPMTNDAVSCPYGGAPPSELAEIVAELRAAEEEQPQTEMLEIV